MSLGSCLALVLMGTAWAGPYPPGAGRPGSDAVPRDDARIKGWASGVAAFTRGPMDISLPGLGVTTYGVPESALGPSDVGEPEQQPEPGSSGPFQVVSLGDGGSITLTFSPPLADGEGPDLAVFENSFRESFLELAFVEVSSDGVNFFRFPAVSLTPTMRQATMNTAIDPTNLHNLAGKHRARNGTPFDLRELSAHTAAGLNLQHVTHVRIVDVVGSLNPAYGSQDSLGNWVNEAWPTAFENGGFDLDAVAALNVAATGLTYAQWKENYAWPEEPGADAPEADPDLDGTPNLLEYAFASDPLAATLPPAPTLTVEEGKWTALFPEPRTDALDLTTAVEILQGSGEWVWREGLAPLALSEAEVATVLCRVVVQLTEP